MGNFFSIYISDRWSKKLLLPIGLVGIGLCGFYLSTFPSLYGIFFTWAMFSLFAEVIYWPVLLKAIRLLGTVSEQGRLFAFLEAGRGVVDIVVAYSALGLFILFGQGAIGFKAGILFFSFVCIVVGIASYFLLQDDIIKTTDEAGNKVSKNKAAWLGVIKACKSLEIWTVSFTIFAVYTIYCGLTYFIPFLKDIYGMPVALVGAYGIINQYGLKIIGGPVGGIVSDKVFKSPAKYICFGCALAAVCIFGFALLPHESMNIYLGLCLTLGIGAIIFSMRAVFFAPIAELGVPEDISGAAMSIACIFGYAPQMFAYALYGRMLDTHPGIEGYRIVFFMMSAAAVAGIAISWILVKMVQKKKAALNEGEL